MGGGFSYTSYIDEKGGILSGDRISVATITRISDEGEVKKVIKTLNSFADVVHNSKFREYLVVGAVSDSISSKVSDILEEINRTRFQNKLRIFFIPIEKSGFSFQRNIALENAKGDILVFIDDDMRISQNAFDELINTIIERKDAVAVSGIVLPEETQSCIGFCQGLLLHPGGGYKMMSHYSGISEIPFFHTGLSAIRRRIFLEFLFSEEMKYGCEDMEISIRIKKKYPHYKFFLNPRSIAYHSTRNSIKEIFLWARRYGRGRYMIYKKYGVEMTGFFIHKFLAFSLISSIFPFLSPITLPAFYSLYYIKLKANLNDMTSKLPYQFSELIRKNRRCFLFLPLVFFAINLGFDIGRIEEMIKDLLNFR